MLPRSPPSRAALSLLLSAGALCGGAPAPAPAEPYRPQAPAVRCLSACQRSVPVGLHPRVCSAGCSPAIQDPGLAQGWVARLLRVVPFPEQALRAALADPDWRVRAAALEVAARRAGVSPAALISARLREAEEPQALQLALVAARGGPAFAPIEPRAAARFRALAEKVSAALEVELYAIDPGERLAALADLAAFTGRGEARVALEAMRSRPASTDEIVAGTLQTWAARGRTTAPGAVLREARREDAPRVDRLLAVWSARLGPLLPALQGGAPPQQRLEAVEAAGELAPLSAPQLRPLLAQEEPALRTAAARALARGEGLALLDAALAHLDAADEPEAVRAGWLLAAGGARGPGCQGRLHAALPEPRAPALRGALLKALAACAGEGALTVLAAQKEQSAPVRAAAVEALAAIPRSPQAEALALAGLEDGEPLVLVAAARVVREQRQARATPRLLALLRHADASVRRAAVEALEGVGGPKAADAVGQRLREDASSEVRGAAAAALGWMGGPDAAAALTHAAAHDADDRVRYLARGSLHRLGFVRDGAAPP